MAQRLWGLSAVVEQLASFHVKTLPVECISWEIRSVITLDCKTQSMPKVAKQRRGSAP